MSILGACIPKCVDNCVPMCPCIASSHCCSVTCLPVQVADDWRAVVCDYGFARRKAAANMTICGTDEFMAPELLFGEAYDDKAVRSCGVLPCRSVDGMW